MMLFRQKTLRLIGLVLMIVASITIISACAGKPASRTSENHWLLQQQEISSITTWTVKGRLGIKTADKNNSANFSWQHLPEEQLFILYGAFGITYAEISQTKDKAILTLSKKQRYESTNIEALIEQNLGYPLPIKHLENWIMGRPTSDNDNQLTFDDSGFLQTIIYQQWTISYKKYRRFSSFNDLFLPSKITITDGTVMLRLSLRDWKMEAML